VQKNAREIFRTRVFTAGSEVRLEFRYKHSRVKQYLKDSRALRIETVINKPADIGVRARARAPARADLGAAAITLVTTSRVPAPKKG
jgi:hypothetical protein